MASYLPEAFLMGIEEERRRRAVAVVVNASRAVGVKTGPGTAILAETTRA
jgi:hypothetical protein